MVLPSHLFLSPGILICGPAPRRLSFINTVLVSTPSYFAFTLYYFQCQQHSTAADTRPKDPCGNAGGEAQHTNGGAWLRASEGGPRAGGPRRAPGAVENGGAAQAALVPPPSPSGKRQPTRRVAEMLRV